MSAIYYREQKHICGKDYDTAPYMEVDLYAVSAKKHRASRRAKRKEATSLAMQTYNDNRAKRYCVQLVNANFTEQDYALTATYDDDHLPAPGEIERVDRDWTAYMRRVYRWCDKHGVERPLWLMATEYTTTDETGATYGRHHHHAIIQHTAGLSRDTLEELWRDTAGKTMGLCRCERLHFDHGSVEGLVQYINKNKRCARRWRQSRGLEKPKTPPPNDSKWSRKKLEEASTLYIDDREFWERKYPGYTLNRVACDQANNGVHVEPDQLQPGDILCFYSGSDYIGHVGIYIGDNKFVHAQNSATGVVVSALEGYYATRGFEARRIIT